MVYPMYHIYRQIAYIFWPDLFQTILTPCIRQFRKEERNMKCIYCNSQTDLTVSDIISYAITGAKLRKQFVCHTHNALTNDRYEKEFIKGLDFLRNQLGFLTRSGEPIQFTADITVDGKEMHKVRMSDRKSLYNPKGVVTGYSDTGSKIYFGTTAKISKIPSASPQIVDVSNISLHTTISSDSFIGDCAVHSIAKMAYEWHCHINQIEEFKPEYDEIVDYILNDVGSDIVSIVVDSYYYRLVDCLSDFGSNALFEYDDVDGYKYVVFALWNAIAYKVRIGKSSAIKANHSSEMLIMYLYHIDGTQETKPFGVVSVSGTYTPCFVTLHPAKITIDEWRVFAERLTCLLRTTVMSIHSLKKQVDELDA